MSGEWDVVRWRCKACDAVTTGKRMLTAVSPFDPTEVIVACPGCRTINQFDRLCDEPGCDKEAYCGTPTPERYRWTCGKHMPKPSRNAGIPGRDADIGPSQGETVSQGNGSTVIPEPSEKAP